MKLIIIKTETLFESVLSDLFTFGLLLLCIYVSRDSAWWTFVTGIMFIVFVVAKFSYSDKNVKTVHSKHEAMLFIESLSDEG